MIKSNDPQVQSIIGALTRQREDALDAVAMAMSTIAAHEATIADLNKKLTPPEPAPLPEKPTNP